MAQAARHAARGSTRALGPQRTRLEIFGILFALPVAYLLVLAYCGLVERVVERRPGFFGVLAMASRIVLVFLGLEVLLLVTLGPVACQHLFGFSFELFHTLLFFLATPAVATLLIYRRDGEVGSPYVAALLSSLFAFLHV